MTRIICSNTATLTVHILTALTLGMTDDQDLQITLVTYSDNSY